MQKTTSPGSSGAWVWCGSILKSKGVTPTFISIERGQMSICVCAKCKQPWKVSGSPARCPDCGQVSFAIAIQIGSHNPATQSVVIPAETRAKLSASTKKRWQDPEYRLRQIATHTGRHPSPETKAKISAALTRWHNKIKGNR